MRRARRVGFAAASPVRRVVRVWQEVGRGWADANDRGWVLVRGRQEWWRLVPRVVGLRRWRGSSGRRGVPVSGGLVGRRRQRFVDL